jgi:hypothetical protein
MEFHRMKKAPEVSPAAEIRLNHTEPGRQFQLINGLRPVREANGSFLVTEEECKSLRGLEGLVRF